MLLLYQPVSEFPNKCNPDWVEKWILKKCLSLLLQNFHWNSRCIFQVDLTWFNKRCWISHRKQLQTYSKSWDQFSVLVGAANDSREAPRFKLPVSSSTLKCFCTIIWVTWMLKASECLQSSPCEAWFQIYLWTLNVILKPRNGKIHLQLCIKSLNLSLKPLW